MTVSEMTAWWVGFAAGIFIGGSIVGGIILWSLWK